MSQRDERLVDRPPYAEPGPPAVEVVSLARARRPEAWRAVNIFLLTAAAFVVVIAGMRAAAGILMPFLLALFIAVICAPVYQGMRRRRVPASLAIMAVLR